MNIIASLARILPKPNLVHYALSLLELFSRWTRKSWEDEFGFQPDPFDPDQPRKDWFDTDPNAGNYTRLQGQDDLNAQPMFVEMKMTAALAAKVNLPGAYRYPAYTPDPTEAVAELLNDHGAIVAKLPVNPRDLTLASQAAALAREVGGVVEGNLGWLAASTKWPTAEARRIWHVRVGDQDYIAGWLVQVKNGNGIGAPGAWEKNGTDVRWVPKPQITDHLDSKVKPVPMPVRPLDPDEEFGRPTPMSGWMVKRIAPAPVTATDGLLAEIVNLLKQAIEMLKAIGRRLSLNL